MELNHELREAATVLVDQIVQAETEDEALETLAATEVPNLPLVASAALVVLATQVTAQIIPPESEEA